MKEHLGKRNRLILSSPESRPFLETLDVGRLKFNRYNGNTAPRPEDGMLTHFKNAINKEDIEIINTYNEHTSPFYDEESKKVSFKAYCKKNNFKGD